MRTPGSFIAPSENAMNTSNDFSFGDNSVAAAYANVLVPMLFEPWAQILVETNQSWEGSDVLDLATGTGIVAQLLAKKVGHSGSVVGMDINQEMLDAAAMRSASHKNIAFALCPAEKIDSPDDSFDHVVCQQSLLMGSGIKQAIEAAYSTPIGPKLRGLSKAAQSRFIAALSDKASHLGGDDLTMGQMATNVLIATK